MTKPILFISDSASLVGLWIEAARQALPGYQPVGHLDGIDPEKIELALVWKPRPGFLASLPNLRLVVSVGAGVDHIVLNDPEFPRHIPLVRMVDPGLTQGMCDYAAWACLSILRKSRYYHQQQTQRAWYTVPVESADQRHIGVLGLGQIGLPVAKTLTALGFRVSGWSRIAKEIDGIETFGGPEGLKVLLGQADMVFNLLPSTPSTHNLFNDEVFALMKPGAAFINAGRGATVNEGALLNALNSGHISQAFLDVFKTEPLPTDHAFWAHPNVTLTPHNAAITHPNSGIRALTRALIELDAGQPLSHQVDWQYGY